MTGQLFFVVGNSGSGKDSLLDSVEKVWPVEYPPLKIAQRFITRPPHESENFISISKDDFLKMQKKNKFCFSWYIYDTYYGISTEILDWVADGAICLANVSRTIVKEAKVRFPEIKIIFVRVPLKITQERLIQRAREPKKSNEFMNRLKRAELNQDFLLADCIIDNTFDLKYGTTELFKYLMQFVKKS